MDSALTYFRSSFTAENQTATFITIQIAREWLNKARRQASQDIQEGSMDDFMNKMGLGDPDPSNYKSGFDGADEIVDWFQRDKPDDWRQRD